MTVLSRTFLIKNKTFKLSNLNEKHRSAKN